MSEKWRPEIFMVAAEMAPFAKVGGLGDVLGALPLALARAGHRVRVLLPAYGTLKLPEKTSVRSHALFPETEFPDAAGKPLRVRYRSFETGGVEVVLADLAAYFSQSTEIYGIPPGASPFSEAERFIVFSRAAAAFIRSNPLPDIVHLHDHPAALVAAMLKEGGREAASVPLALTIHNIAYQGLADARHFALTGLPDRLMAPLGPCEFFGRLNPLKAGVVYSDAVTTVSPAYAREIRTAEKGYGLDGLLRQNAGKLVGILNGIDTSVWDPGTDAHLARRYSRKDPIGKILDAKAENRRRLQAELELPVRDVPLVAFMGRLAAQKGIDWAIAAAPGIVSRGCQMAFLGVGEPWAEEGLRDLARRFPDAVAVRLTFDEGLAHRWAAGATHFLVPSRFEPCGLVQMYAMAYGTLPIVRRTGGLADTVVDLEGFPDRGTGFVFDAEGPEAVGACVSRALRTAPGSPAYAQAVGRCMAQRFSWDERVGEYIRLYERLAAGRKSPRKQRSPKRPEEQKTNAWTA